MTREDDIDMFADWIENRSNIVSLTRSNSVEELARSFTFTFARGMDMNFTQTGNLYTFAKNYLRETYYQ